MRHIIGYAILVILSGAPADADDSLAGGMIRVAPKSWVPTHAGEALLNGFPVNAYLEESRDGVEVPEYMAGLNDALVPTLAKPVKRSYRLTLATSGRPGEARSFELRPVGLSIDGMTRFAYASRLDASVPFHFMVTAASEGRIHVAYSVKVSEGAREAGEFLLPSVPHIY